MNEQLRVEPHDLARLELYKASDAIERAYGALHLESFQQTDYLYALDQIKKARTWTLSARSRLENELGRRANAAAEFAARQQVSGIPHDNIVDGLGEEDVG